MAQGEGERLKRLRDAPAQVEASQDCRGRSRGHRADHDSRSVGSGLQATARPDTGLVGTPRLGAGGLETSSTPVVMASWNRWTGSHVGTAWTCILALLRCVGGPMVCA